jgi:hypothetical protein
MNEVLLTERTLAETERLVGVELHDRGVCAFKNVLSPVGVFAARSARPRHQHAPARFSRLAASLEGLPAMAAEPAV